MMETKTFKIDGLEEVMKALEELPLELQSKIIKSFLQKTGKKFIVDELRSALPYSIKTKKSLRVMSDPNDKTAIYAGVSADRFWLRFVELGTIIRRTKEGAYRGSIVARNQVGKVIDSEIEPIIDYTNNEFGNEIAIILEKKIKKITKT